jgi:hypothetical protein
MRPVLLVSAAVLSLAVLPCHAGTSRLFRRDIPAIVLQAFAAAHPTERIREQVLVTEGARTLYKLQYVDRKIETDVVISVEGAIVGTDRTIAVEELPPAVIAACKKEFPDARIRDAETITRDSVVTYGLDLKIGRDHFDAAFRSDGTLIKKDVPDEDASGRDR